MWFLTLHVLGCLQDGVLTKQLEDLPSWVSAFGTCTGTEWQDPQSQQGFLKVTTAAHGVAISVPSFSGGSTRLRDGQGLTGALGQS